MSSFDGRSVIPHGVTICEGHIGRLAKIASEANSEEGASYPGHAGGNG